MFVIEVYERTPGDMLMIIQRSVKISEVVVGLAVGVFPRRA